MDASRPSPARGASGGPGPERLHAGPRVRRAAGATGASAAGDGRRRRWALPARSPGRPRGNGDRLASHRRGDRDVVLRSSSTPSPRRPVIDSARGAGCSARCAIGAGALCWRTATRRGSVMAMEGRGRRNLAARHQGTAESTRRGAGPADGRCPVGCTRAPASSTATSSRPTPAMRPDAADAARRLRRLATARRRRRAHGRAAHCRHARYRPRGIHRRARGRRRADLFALARCFRCLVGLAPFAA